MAGKFRRLLRSALVVAAQVAVTTFAFGHAPPEGSGIRWFEAGAKQLVVVRTNRGFVFSEDDGASWRMVCPAAYGATLTETAQYAFTSQGRFLVSSYARGLQQASADLCSFDIVPGALANTPMQALEPLPGTPGSFVATAQADDHLLASANDGVTWTPPSPVRDFLFTLQVAPSDARRLYATAFHEGDGGVVEVKLISSGDGGKTFSALTVPMDAAQESTVSVIGVDADEPKRAYLRVVATGPELPERLLRTEDAGLTLTDVLTTPGPMVLRSVPGGPTWLGAFENLMRSDDEGKTFKRWGAADGISRIQCIEHHEGKLYVCGYFENEFGVLVSPDDGKTFSWFLRFPDVSEQVACPASSPAIRECAQLWYDWQVEQGQISGASGAPGSGGSASGGTAPGSGGSAGGSGSGGSPPPGSGGAPSGAGNPGSDGGCGCRVGARTNAEAALLLAGALLVLGARRRRVV